MTRTSQLQIRISPQEKATLKRLAGLEGLSVSAYVLSRALPSATHAVDAALNALRAGASTQAEALATLRRLVEGLGPDDVAESLAQANLADLPPVTQNYVAGVAEQLATSAGAEPPSWASQVLPLERPHFRWPLRSLRPYQLRASPLALARRNVFDPTEVVPALAGSAPASPSVEAARFQQISQHLRLLELDAEFYFLGGAILYQVLPRRGSTARPAALFRRTQPQADPVADLAGANGWGAGWLEDAVRRVLKPLGGAGRYLELPHVRLFAPPPAYALAIKLASRSESGLAATEDLRFILRILNVSGIGAALSLVGNYFAERQLPSDTRDVLAPLLPH